VNLAFDVRICPNVRKRNGKDFQLQLAVNFLVSTKTKGPNGRTYIENSSDLIAHEKELVSHLQPITHDEFQPSIRLQKRRAQRSLANTK